MSETTIGTTPIPVSPAELGIDDAPSVADMSAAQQRVIDELQVRGIDSSTVLLAGYSPAAPKDMSVDHFDPSDKTYDYSFSTVDGMELPAATDDTELAREKILVNPLYYAMRDGAKLGVYDQSKLPAKREVDEDIPSNVSVWASDQAHIDAAKLLDIDFAAPADSAVETNAALVDTMPRSQVKELAGMALSDVAVEPLAEVPTVGDQPPAEAITEPSQPTLNEAFVDGASLERILRDPQTAPELQQSIRTIMTAYRNAERAGVVEDAWGLISPQLSGLSGTLPLVNQSVEMAATDVQVMAANLQELSRALDDGDIERATQVLQGAELHSNAERLKDLINTIGSEPALTQVSAALRNSEAESDELVKRVMAPDQPLDAEGFEQLAETVRPLIEQGLDEGAIKAELQKDVPEEVMTSWRNKQQAIQELVNFSKISDTLVASLPQAFTGAMNDLEGYLEVLGQGMRDPAEAQYLAQRLQAIYYDTIDPTRRMLSVTTGLLTEAQ